MRMSRHACGTNVSYAQRFEDLHLLRCFGAQDRGFYIDIGAGHPVYDNVSFAFYLHGWSGITVEPNPWLAELSAGVRPRDQRIQSLVGAEPGEATYYLVEDFHGLSTTIASNAQAALHEYGKPAQAMTMPVTTLSALCEQHAPAADRFPQDRRRGRREGRARRRRLAAVPAQGRGARGAGPGHAGAGLGRLGAAAHRARLSLRLVRQPQPLLRRRGARRPGAAASRPSRRRSTASPQFRDFKPALDDALASGPSARRRCSAGADMVRLPLLHAGRRSPSC